MLLLPPNPKIAWPSYENQPSFICFTDSIGNNPRIVLLFPFTIQILPCARFFACWMCLTPDPTDDPENIVQNITLATKQTDQMFVQFTDWLYKGTRS